MKHSFFISILVLFLFMPVLGPAVFAQTAEPNMPFFWWDRVDDYIKNGTMTFTYKTLTSPTITSPTISGTVANSGTGTYSGTNTFYTFQLGTGVLDTLGRTLIKVQNKTGSALALGDAVVWDNAAVAVVADAAPAADATIANDLTGEGGWRTLSVACTGTPDAGDSIKVWGTTYEGGANDYTKMLLPASSGATFAVVDTTTAAPILHWSQIDSIKYNADAVSDGASAVTVNSYGVATVLACDGANTDVAGIAIGAIADNAFGYICVHGVCKATVDAGTNAASPGVLLEGAANGDLVVDAAATTGKNIARALEYSTIDNKQILVFVDSF